ncbi:uncharacterized protein [Pyxicephalus adspersus]|uniref:uncharacterized protein isoform X2 n=1 Tax=Pyxicephalus adspersus TaxID=30357 RepID=UPI003B5AF663
MSRDPEDVWSPDYDSTWEEEGEEKPRGHKEPGSRRQPNNCRKWMSRAARDLQNYRHGYVNDKNYLYYSSQPKQTPNLDFYQNNRHFEPEGLYITQLLDKWKKKYDILERNHSYIQWLFPLREYGMNSYAKPLTEAEIELMKKDPLVRERFIRAYKLMLDFYGIRLKDEKTGKVTRTMEWKERFRNLNDHSHNNLRITRILKCLGELGFEHFQAPLVKFFLEETLCNGELQNVKRSALDYFIFTVKDKNERRKLVHFAWKNYKQERFIWGPVEKLRAYQPPAENEQETKDCPKENNEESRLNGQLDSCGNNSDEEEYSDSDDVACQQKSSNSDEKNGKELIPLHDRAERKEHSHGKFPKEGCSGCSETVSDNKGLLSTYSSQCMNGMQLLPEVDKKSYEKEENQVSYVASPKPDHEVPSAGGHLEEGNDGHVMDKTVSKNPTENLQQENVYKKIDNMPIETQRKRKMTNFDREGIPDRGPSQSDDNSGQPKEGGEGNRMDGVEDKVKKLKLSGQSAVESNQIVADDPPNIMIGGNSQKPVDSSSKSQEGEECSQMLSEEAKEEMPKLHRQSNSEKGEKQDDDLSVSSSREDLKQSKTDSGLNQEGAEES